MPMLHSAETIENICLNPTLKFHLITELKIRLWLSHIKTLKWKSSDTFPSKYPYTHIFNSKKGAKMHGAIVHRKEWNKPTFRQYALDNDDLN
ncbi:hypothetical protein T01_10108 [Trichinella spiralis]|uniref:Uncharacterized protein n=1 Tax=Trichinella spiralis TaxID=6334 RepID=A0A0V1BHI5_TRISP|nr:hypothetical protein T01_10108 [Trichinella spiralis]